VFRFAVLYFVMLFVFVGLIVGPAVGGAQVGKSLNGLLPASFSQLLQPNDLNNDDTRGTTQTGTATEVPTNTQDGSGPTNSPASNKIRLF